MYGASSSIVVSMLTPLARRVISRTRRLNRSKAFGAMARLTSGPAVKLNPRNFRSCGLMINEAGVDDDNIRAEEGCWLLMLHSNKRRRTMKTKPAKEEHRPFVTDI